MNVSEQLLHAFQVVFPSQSSEELKAGTPDTLSTWDSTNHIVLISVVEEVFETKIPDDTAGELLSFQDFEAYLDASR